MRVIRKIIAFLAISLSLVLIREFVAIYTDLKAIDPIYATIFIVFILLLIVYFVLIPLIQIITTTKIPPPVTEPSKEIQLIEKRVKIFESSDAIKKIIVNDISVKEKYQTYVSQLEKEASKIRNRYVTNVFYSTSISQNGFLDGIIILSAGANVIKDIFRLYNGRVSNRDLLTIIKKIYTAMAIGGSEIVQYSTDEIIPLISTKGVQTIPLFDKVISSATDGFVNAAMIARIAIITENYCKMTVIKSDRDLLPSYKIVFDTTKHILGDIFNKIKFALPKISLSDELNYSKYIVAPFKYVIEKIDSVKNKENEFERTTTPPFLSAVLNFFPQELNAGKDKVSELKKRFLKK